MRTTARHFAIGQCLVVFAALGAAACNDDDKTVLCVGPGCATYDGIAGRNSFANAGGSGGAGAAEPGGAGGVAPDASPDGGDTAVPEAGTGDPVPEAGTDAPAPLEDCEVTFASPAALDAGSLTLAAGDDVDEEACGQVFTTSVSVASNASTVNLFVNDNPIGLVAVLNGSAAFEAVLGNRGATANTLRAEADMGDGRTCSVSFGGGVFVDCAGPSCSIELPVANDGAYLSSSQDDEPGTAGLQTELVVSTEVEHTGQPVRIEIDEAFDLVPDQLVENAGINGRATFPTVTLAEGVRAVRAECRDEFDVVTLSPITEWNVDVTPCTLTIDEVAGGADPITPANDIDVDMGNGLSVLLGGHITGDNCELVHVGDCDGTLTPIPISGQLGQDGSFSVPVLLGSETTRLDVCANVQDEAGNVSSPNAEVGVNVRTTSPAVAIASPLTNTRVNIAGGENVLADGEPSSSTCEVDVVAHCTELGVNVQLFEDNVQISAQPCVGQADLPGAFLGQATFSALSLRTKNDGLSSTLRAQQSALGLPDGVSSDVLIQADCSAPSCTITGPDLSLNFLNAAADSSGLAGFQANFQVLTEAESAGQDVRLTFDGDAGGSPSATAVLGSGGALASFDDVTLSEALHSVQAACADPAGNVQTSSIEEWTVDTTPCSTSLIVAGSANPITPASDSDVATADLQVTVTGQSVGGDCSTVRVHVCADQAVNFSALGSGGGFSLPLTLASTTGNVSVCADLEDAAGNVGSSNTSVNVRVDPPVVSFATPADGSRFNLGTGCGTSVVVSCTDLGVPVTLEVDGVPAVQACLSGNIATFPVVFDTKNGGAGTQLTARQTADGLTSTLASINIQADCEAPVLAFTDPLCNTQLAFEGDDLEPGLPGLQIDASVTNGGVPDVSLTVTRGAATTDTRSSGDLVTTNFLSVDLGGPGSIVLDACATDPQGNEGCATSCPLTIAAEPSVTFTHPAADPALITSTTPDCDAIAAGFQVTVSGTSNAANGSSVQLTLGLGATKDTTVTNGTFSACVAAPEGNDQILTATVTDTSTGLIGDESVVVSVDSRAPISVNVTGRRQGTVNLSWPAFLDGQGAPFVSYQLRCSPTNITSEGTWNTATDIPLAVVPSAVASTPQTRSLTNFRTGTHRFCAVRGMTSGGLLSALEPATNVTNPFRTQVYPLTNTSDVLQNIAALGDINGDGESDFIYGLRNAGARVFFGGPALTTAPGIQIIGPASPAQFGVVVAGVGDINGDGRDDFAVGGRVITNGVSPNPVFSNAGSVFVFFGRTSDDPWPTSITVSASPGCGADICFHGAVASSSFGSAIGSTNFDGEGPTDLIIGARAHNATRGRTYVVLGGTQLDVPRGTIFDMPTSNPDGFVIDPPSSTRTFGVNVAGVGVGSDTRGDLVITALGTPNPGGVLGEAFFVTGEAHTGTGLIPLAAGTPVAFANGAAFEFGNSMRALGDINGDGFSDVWVSTDFNVNGHNHVYLGGASGFAGASALLLYSNDVGDNEWGTFVASGFHTELELRRPLGDPADPDDPPDSLELNDLDGNGLGEIAVGSVTGNGVPGRVELFYADAGLGARARTNADALFVSTGNGNMNPSFVGDIDGDSFNDLAILDSGASITTRLTLLY